MKVQDSDLHVLIKGLVCRFSLPTVVVELWNHIKATVETKRPTCLTVGRFWLPHRHMPCTLRGNNKHLWVTSKKNLKNIIDLFLNTNLFEFDMYLGFQIWWLFLKQRWILHLGNGICYIHHPYKINWWL